MESLAGGKFAFGPNGSEMKQFFLTEEAYNGYKSKNIPWTAKGGNVSD